MTETTARYGHATEILRQVGHDLKSPLTAIIGSLEALSNLGSKLSDAQKAQLYRTGLKEAYRLQHFIQNILTLSKIESDFQIQKSDVSLDVLYSGLQSKMAQIHPYVTCKAIFEPGFVINADEKWLTEALWQVLDNIGKHNTSDVHCSVDAGRSGPGTTLLIQDNGVGIGNDWAENVFRKHFKGPATQNQDASAGVGLTIAQRIIEAHGGTIELSGEGEGATFLITLP